MARPADFDLSASIRRPNFTPSRRDLPALTTLLQQCDEALLPHVLRAMVALGPAAVAVSLTALDGHRRPEDDSAAHTARAVRWIQLLALSARHPHVATAAAGRDALQHVAQQQLAQPQPTLPAPALRRLLTALGQLALPQTNDCLLAWWDRGQHDAALQKVLITALGQCGDVRAAARLATVATHQDREIERRLQRASLMQTRDQQREARDVRQPVGNGPARDVPTATNPLRGALMPARNASTHEGIVTTAHWPHPRPVRLRMRQGLGALAAAELRAIAAQSKTATPSAPATGRPAEPRPVGQWPTPAAITWHAYNRDYDEICLDAWPGPWAPLYQLRLWQFIAVAVPLAVAPPPTQRATMPAPTDEHELTRVVDALTHPALIQWLQAQAPDPGPIRWRAQFSKGRQRSAIWQLALAVQARTNALLNDPREATWDVRIDWQANELLLVPKQLHTLPSGAPADARFAWRVADVPASSHPTVAAALVQLAAVTNADTVWDPFCGAGAELFECAARAPAARLLGSDLSPTALGHARANAAAWQTAAPEAAPTAWTQGDARNLQLAAFGGAPFRATLIISNPPLGGRIRGDMPNVLVEALPNIVAQLERGGRLVWFTPAPQRTDPVAARLGLRLQSSTAVNLGGIIAHAQRWEY